MWIPYTSGYLVLAIKPLDVQNMLPISPKRNYLFYKGGSSDNFHTTIFSELDLTSKDGQVYSNKHDSPFSFAIMFSNSAVWDSVN